jgi:hypothetical protein
VVLRFAAGIPVEVALAAFIAACFESGDAGGDAWVVALFLNPLTHLLWPEERPGGGPSNEAAGQRPNLGKSVEDQHRRRRRQRTIRARNGGPVADGVAEVCASGQREEGLSCLRSGFSPRGCD